MRGYNGADGHRRSDQSYGQGCNRNQAEMNFIDLIDKSWPNWEPPVLPTQFMNAVKQAGSHAQVVRNLKITRHSADNSIVVSVRKVSPLDTLSRREREVADKIARGLSYKSVARELGISPKTVANHLSNVNLKLNITSRADLISVLSD